MSRIGKKIIIIPDGVTIKVDGNTVIAKGPLGEDKVTLLENIYIEQEEKQLYVKISEGNDDKNIAAFHGLIRSLINNVVIGVSKGFEKELEIIGVGYRATQQDKNLQFQLGYSHNILFPAPEGISLEVKDAVKLKVSGINKQLVGQVAANIRKLRPPEPYKGKGIRYKNEYVRKKAGKAGK